MAVSKFIKLVNGLPVAQTFYDESINYSSGLTANTTITLPNSGSFTDSSAKDLLVIYNNMVMEVTRDFTVVGAGPTYTQIQFIVALPNDAKVRFRQNI